MKNITATIEKGELVLRVKLDSPIGKTDRGTVILAQTDYQERIGAVAFKANFWLAKNPVSKGLSQVTTDEQAALKAQIANMLNASK